jgi:hypothetical protein
MSRKVSNFRTGMTALVKVLAIKSIIELLFVGALSVAFYMDTFKPSFRGALDTANEKSINGWALDRADQSQPVEVQLFLNGHFAGTQFARSPRPDIVQAGLARDGMHGFVFVPLGLESGRYEARVYAVQTSGKGQRKTLQQIGVTRIFETAGNSPR